jgi:hypothetical protein
MSVSATVSMQRGNVHADGNCASGYVVRGAILERVGGKTWEELIDLGMVLMIVDDAFRALGAELYGRFKPR